MSAIVYKLIYKDFCWPLTHIIHSHFDLKSVSTSGERMYRLRPMPSRRSSPAPRVRLPPRAAASSSGGSTSLRLKPAPRNSLELMIIAAGGYVGKKWHRDRGHQKTGGEGVCPCLSELFLIMCRSTNGHSLLAWMHICEDLWITLTPHLAFFFFLDLAKSHQIQST